MRGLESEAWNSRRIVLSHLALLLKSLYKINVLFKLREEKGDYSLITYILNPKVNNRPNHNKRERKTNQDRRLCKHPVRMEYGMIKFQLTNCRHNSNLSPSDLGHRSR